MTKPIAITRSGIPTKRDKRMVEIASGSSEAIGRPVFPRDRMPINASPRETVSIMF